MNRLLSQIKAALLGSMRASPPAGDYLEKVTHDTGDVDAMTATGTTTQYERALTAEEARRFGKLVSYRFIAWRWISGIGAGILLACIGVYAFQFVALLGLESTFGDLANSVAWVFMGAGAVLVLGTFFAPLGMLRARQHGLRDLRAGRVLCTTGRLAKHAKPPQYYWVVGEKAFLIVEGELWEGFEDGDMVQVDWLPESGNILQARAGGRTLDFLREAK